MSITTIRHSRELETKLALSNGELRALEAQLNPHFLFNCLNSIRGMISEDQEQAQDMVTRLANILRYNLLRDRQHSVPLASELGVVSDYFALESIRFEDRLHIHNRGRPSSDATVQFHQCSFRPWLRMPLSTA